MKKRITYTLQQRDKVEKNGLIIKKGDNSILLLFKYIGTECSLSFGVHQDTTILTFEFGYNFLSEISFDLNLIDTILENTQQDICCNTQAILHQILTTKYKENFKNIFIESKALELLLCSFNCYSANASSCEGCKFLNLPTEKEKIVKAKEILLYNLEQPPTIPELAKQVGINQCYLKKGFKEMFDSTVYDYIQHQRMQKARMLLISTTQPIGAIAEAVGFSSVSSFSQSFKKIVGVLPSELQKQ